MHVRSLSALLCLSSWTLLAAAPARAQDAATPFALPRPPELVVPAIADADLDALLARLDEALPPEEAAGPSPDVWRSTLWSFARRLQAVRMTTDQEARVQERLSQIGRERPALAPLVESPARMVRTLTVGKIAPDLVGRDLDGVEFRLSDYRGKVVVVAFSASWCAICRSQYPYQRMLLELYGNWPFAILGVDGSPSAEAAATVKATHGLTYRSWWDEPTADAPDGRLSGAWNVRGRPTLYVIDAKGVIRFVDLRYEDLLKGVRQVLNEHMADVDRQRRTPLR